MRQFSSYGPVDTELHYHAPREELIQKGLLHLVGQYPAPTTGVTVIPTFVETGG